MVRLSDGGRKLCLCVCMQTTFCNRKPQVFRSVQSQRCDAHHMYILHAVYDNTENTILDHDNT